MPNYLSKSDFKVAHDCATKLFYKKRRFPTTWDDDPYMEFLADGGFMVGKFAQLQCPEGILIGELDSTKAVEQTERLLANENATLFEPAFMPNGFLIRVDILKKQGLRFQLIEVKSKSYNPVEGFLTNKGQIRSEWKPYIEDIAFQRMVLQLAHPTAIIECFLLLPNKATISEIDLLPTYFSITRNGRQAEVEFTGNVAELQASRLLRLCPVDDAVSQVIHDVQNVASELLPLVADGPKRAEPIIGYKCRDCEYRVSKATGTQNGFRDCWGKLADVTPSILDLYKLGLIKLPNKAILADKYISEGKASLYDVPDSALTTAYAARQRTQIQNTHAGTEWRSADLKPVLDKLSYPLHFIDFETSRIALPYHRGMRPYEQVAFQWSCHTLHKPGGELVHTEWINVEETFPNIAFAAALRSAIGSSGTLLTWSHHENTTLNDIARQIIDYELNDDGIRDWLLATTASGRIFDLCDHALKNYFHPSMAGSVSIKKVLPAIWGVNEKLRGHDWFKEFFKTKDGAILDPYETLPKLEIFEHAEVVDEGTGAMRAYQEMLYGAGRSDPKVKQAWRDLLLQYCRLDTLAMLIIWKHWMD